MNSNHFMKNEEMALKCGKGEERPDAKSSLTFLTFWPNVNKEFFQDNLSKTLERINQLIYKASQYGKFSFSNTFYFHLYNMNISSSKCQS